jgi:asparagine synthase (glutamine-hydrolysing)
MCGIAGIITQHPMDDQRLRALERMSAALRHRGPDDHGSWLSPCRSAAFAHRRLSIIDLSAAGHQPMSSRDARFTIAFNGEIYNFAELRTSLEAEGRRFHTKTDTEVILALYEKEGSECVKRLRGMFAFALWDDREKTCLLARDPLGIKPLYVHESNGLLAFASELGALCQGELFRQTLSAPAVERYFQTGSIPEPLTLVNEATCLEAGQTLLWKVGSATRSTFWKLDFSSPAPRDPIKQTREALLDSVRHHFVSDVPVGVFLSGGIDSTALLALAKATGHEGINACSIAVDDAAADESPIARRTAAHFGADYHEMMLDAEEAQELFGEFLKHIDQPSIDGLNTFTVSSLARRQGMKVVLSGLGGDEVFGGYASFARIPQMMRWQKALRFVPGAAALLDRGKPQHRRMADFIRSPGTAADAYSALRGIFCQADARKLSQWITGSSSLSQPSENQTEDAAIPDAISRMELTRYMRNQLLRDSDVMSMAHGLELRVPFVDRALIESVAGIPAAIRLQDGKRLLTDAVPEVPEWVVNQKKRGFLFPYQKWMGSAWKTIFDEACLGAPVPVVTWYQRWCVFILKHAAQKLGLSAGP